MHAYARPHSQSFTRINTLSSFIHTRKFEKKKSSYFLPTGQPEHTPLPTLFFFSSNLRDLTLSQFHFHSLHLSFLTMDGNLPYVIRITFFRYLGGRQKRLGGKRLSCGRRDQNPAQKMHLHKNKPAQSIHRSNDITSDVVSI